jgi:signal transduction histidine kinase
LETFLEEMKRYMAFGAEDAKLLRELSARMEKYLPEMAERFYAQIPKHPDANRVFTEGQDQVNRLKGTLQQWARGLFGGVYDQAYADLRYRIGAVHVRIGLEQKYVISAMGIVRAFLTECLLLEFTASDVRIRYSRSLGKILDLDLNLMCQSYMEATTENLRLLNEQLERANRDLAELSHTKDEFLAHTSHELRTPLNSILGFTKLILDGFANDPKEQQELLRDVYASAQHLLGLVNDILDIGRIEAGRMPLQIEDIDPRQLLDSTMPLVTVQASEKKIDLRDETVRKELPWVRGDAVRLRQVLLNVLQNAVKFTNKGWVRVRAAQDTKGMLRFEVHDSGIGVPRDKTEAVFQKFVQAHPSHSSRQGGTGLGLSISRRLVEMMGGSIGLESEGEDRGTLVWFTLPLAKAARPEPEPAAVKRG